MSRNTKDYSALKALLEEQETFPLQFTYKFIGHNSAEFQEGILTLQKTFPSLRHTLTRKSGGDEHIALTYLFEASNAESIIEIFRAIEKIDDLILIL